MRNVILILLLLIAGNHLSAQNQNDKATLLATYTVKFKEITFKQLRSGCCTTAESRGLPSYEFVVKGELLSSFILCKHEDGYWRTKCINALGGSEKYGDRNCSLRDALKDYAKKRYDADTFSVE
jgi:hypothetical protein